MASRWGWMPFIERSPADQRDDLVGHLHEHVGLLLELRHRRDVAVAELEPVADLEHVVDDVVELLGEGVDVLTVERRDERRVEPAQDRPGELVAALLADDHRVEHARHRRSSPRRAARAGGTRTPGRWPRRRRRARRTRRRWGGGGTARCLRPYLGDQKVNSNRRLGDEMSSDPLCGGVRRPTLVPWGIARPTRWRHTGRPVRAPRRGRRGARTAAAAAPQRVPHRARTDPHRDRRAWPPGSPRTSSGRPTSSSPRTSPVPRR